MKLHLALPQNWFVAISLKYTMTKFGRRILFSLSLLALPAAANANLVDRGLVTYDTQSGLEWLDLNQTKGLSFDQVSAQFGSGGLYAGYRYATSLEAQGLLTEFGLPIVPYTTYAPNTWLPTLASFDALLGLNVGGLGPAYGFEAETGDTVGGAYRQLFYGDGSSMNTAMNADPTDAVAVGDRLVSQTAEVTVGYADSYAERNLSHFLVRVADPVTAVPEPQVYALMLSGLAALSVLFRRRTKAR